MPVECVCVLFYGLGFEEKPYRIIISDKRDLILLFISKRRLEVVKIQ